MAAFNTVQYLIEYRMHSVFAGVYATINYISFENLSTAIEGVKAFVFRHNQKFPKKCKRLKVL